MQELSKRHWKNKSVARFAAGGDPVLKIHEKSSAVALNAMENGWAGPPFDPFELAKYLNINVIPNSELLEARTIPIKGNRMQIEYNPDRPRARIRYSVAHEIAHTFFPDCAERVRHRGALQDREPNDWELEMLCNLGAAELLMPTGSLADLKNKPVSIQDVLEIRKTFEVSVESILLRLMRITEQPYAMFVASRGKSVHARYSVDYGLFSRTSSIRLKTNGLLPKESIVSACTAIGYTAIADEDWPTIGRVHLECVGVPPYPGSVFPRVIGLIHQCDSQSQNTGRMQLVVGDATEPHGNGTLILAHVVNDATPNWGAGFGKAVQRKWPEVQSRFRQSWIRSNPKRLGEVYLSEVDAQLSVCQMVCQHGYGTSVRPRIRYAALRDCLSALRDQAVVRNASIHMPRIGSGEAGGSWTLVSALIDEVLCAAGLSVTVYDLPNSRHMRSTQRGLFDQMG